MSCNDNTQELPITFLYYAWCTSVSKST